MLVISGKVKPLKLSVSTLVMKVGTLKTLAALARATALFFSSWRSILATPKAICGCRSIISRMLFRGLSCSRMEVLVVM